MKIKKASTVNSRIEIADNAGRTPLFEAVENLNENPGEKANSRTELGSGRARLPHLPVEDAGDVVHSELVTCGTCTNPTFRRVEAEV